MCNESLYKQARTVHTRTKEHAIMNALTAASRHMIKKRTLTVVQTLTILIGKPLEFVQRRIAMNPLGPQAFWFMFGVSAFLYAFAFLSASPLMPLEARAELEVLCVMTGSAVTAFFLWLFMGSVMQVFSASSETQVWGRLLTRLRTNLGAYIVMFVLYALLLTSAVLFPLPTQMLVNSQEQFSALQSFNQYMDAQVSQSFFGRLSTVLSYGVALFWVVLIFLGIREITNCHKRAFIGTLVLGGIYVLVLLHPWFMVHLF